MNFIAKGNKVNDVSVRNKWRFEWLEGKDENGVSFSEWCKKINEAGLCYCYVCNKKINYGNNGKKTLKKHADDKLHQRNFRGLQSATTFPIAKPVAANALSLHDRKANQKAMVSCFISENSLPFTMAPKVIKLCQALAKDKQALSSLKMERTAATYITTHGVAKTMREELVTKMKNNFFSMNVDEATNNNGDKILNVLVRVYDDDQNKVITAHFGSRKENLATANNIFLKLKDLLESNDISFSEAISCLFDNCATMRGCKSGVEKLARNENKYLLDIDGDLAHKVHNTAKLFYSFFDKFVEDCATDVFLDINESPKASELFLKLQEILKLPKKLKLIRPIDNRFVQMAEVCARLALLMDVLILYYASFLSSEEEAKYNSLLAAIFDNHRFSADQKKNLQSQQFIIKKQKRSEVNKTRKDAIISTIFFHHEKLICLLKFYRETLPFFNKMVKFFQKEEPIFHLVHAELFDFVKTFLSFFIKPEFLPTSMFDCRGFELLPEKQLSDKYLNVGNTAYGLVKKANERKSKWVEHFFVSLREAYAQTSKYILKNFPSNNKALLYFSALHPKFRKESTCLSAFMNLGEMLPNVISEDDVGCLLNEVKMYITDRKIDAINMSDGGRIDTDWWAYIFEIKDESGLQKYKILSRLVKALLSIFSGPLVEGTFNIMDDIICEDRTSLALEHYEASSLVKYYLKSQGKESTTIVPDHKMRANIFSARRVYQESLNKKIVANAIPSPSIPVTLVSTTCTNVPSTSKARLSACDSTAPPASRELDSSSTSSNQPNKKRKVLSPVNKKDEKKQKSTLLEKRKISKPATITSFFMKK